MPVDPLKPRHILVIHGVQPGKAEDLDHAKIVKELISDRKGGNPIQFKTSLFNYEEVNDQVSNVAKALSTGLSKTPIHKKVVDYAIDISTDVIINLLNGKLATEIKKKLRERIIEIYSTGEPCYLVAHSLGSIYAFDVVNELIQETQYFDSASRKTWPVQGLLTIGSPIGLGMFRKVRQKISPLDYPRKGYLKWINYFDLTDPVVSGEIFGKTLTKLKMAESYLTRNFNCGWIIRDKYVDTGKVWLAAHISYWNDPQIGDDLVDLIAN